MFPRHSLICTSLFISVHSRLISFIFILSFAPHSIFTILDKKIIINDLGNLYFFENRHEIKFHLNFSTINENAKAINNCIDRITNDCNKIFSNKNCDYFINTLSHNKREIQKDIAYFNTQRKLAKRAIILIPVLLGIGIMALIALIASERASFKLAQSKALSNLDILNQNLNITSDFIHRTSDSLSKIISEMKDVRYEIDSINSKLILLEEFNDMLHIISLSLITHNDFANKFSHFFRGDLNSNFFSIIDIIEFNTKMDLLKSKLDPKFLLPPLNPYDLIKSSQIFSNHNKTHISISIFVPLLNRENLTFFEFMPIPFYNNNETFIWDTKVKKFYKTHNNSIQIVPEIMLKSCFNHDRIIICNSLLKLMTLSPDKCTLSSIKYRNNDKCAYKNIPTKNYIFRTSSNSLYFHIINPISLKLLCLEKTIFFNVTTHRNIQLEKYCEIFEFSSMHHDSESPTILSINDLSAFPHLQIYDKSSKNWSDNITPLEKNNIHLIGLINDTENAKNDLIMLKEEIDKSVKSRSAFSFLDDFWDDSMNKLRWIKNNLIASIILFILIPIILYISIKICTRFKCKN